MENVEVNGQVIQRQSGILVRQGDSAKGATVEYDDWYAKEKNSYLSNLKSDREREIANSVLDNIRFQSREHVLNHETHQGIEAYTADLHKNITTKLDSNEFDNAKGALASSKNRISPDAYIALEKTIQGKEFDNLRGLTWQNVSNYKLADGSPDYAKQSALVDKMDLPIEKKDSIKDYIKAKGNEMAMIKREQDKATDYSFMEELYKGKKQGAGLDQSLTLVSKYGDGAWDKAQKEDIVKKLYSPENIKTDPVTYVAIWRGIKNNQVTANDVYSAYKQGKISGSDFMELSKLTNKGEGNLKAAYDRIEISAKELYKNETDRAKYLYTVKQIQTENPSISGDELIKKADDLGKKVVTSPGWLWDTKETLYKVELAKSDAKNKAWGTLESDFGRDVVNAIGRIKSDKKFL